MLFQHLVASILIHLSRTVAIRNSTGYSSAWLACIKGAAKIVSPKAAEAKVLAGRLFWLMIHWARMYILCWPILPAPTIPVATPAVGITPIASATLLMLFAGGSIAHASGVRLPGHSEDLGYTVQGGAVQRRRQRGDWAKGKTVSAPQLDATSPFGLCCCCAAEYASVSCLLLL